MKNPVLLLLVLSLLIPANGIVFSEHVLDIEAHAQYLDISQLESEKETFVFDEKSYDVYYGYRGSLDDMSSSTSYPILSSMNINQENKSIEIIMESVPEKTDFWVRMPDKVIYAENEQFTVLVDGINTRYDLMKFPEDHVVGFIIDKDTKNIEIIGTQVIPEFDSLSILPIGILIVILLVIVIRHNQKKSLQPRIN